MIGCSSAYELDIPLHGQVIHGRQPGNGIGSPSAGGWDLLAGIDDGSRPGRAQGVMDVADPIRVLAFTKKPGAARGP